MTGFCFDADTHIYFYLDTSGSMNAELPQIRDAVDELKTLLDETVYHGTADQHVHTVDNGQERWVQWLQQAPAKTLVLAFINESATIYHESSGEHSGPRSAYLADYNAFLQHRAGYARFNALVYAVLDETFSPNAYQVFRQHLAQAIAGTNGYPAGLRQYGVDYRLDVPPSRTAAEYLADIRGWLVGLCGGEADRLRSSVNESVTSLLESVDARPVDARVSESFTLAVEHAPQQLVAFREVTQGEGQHAMAYYPRPVQNTASENQYQGITLLTRLRNWWPPTIFDSIERITNGLEERWSAQRVLEHVLGVWSSQQPWLQVNPIPDLRLRITGREPGDYGPSEGLVTTETITIDQGGNRRRDALAVLNDLLSPFPGTVVRQDSQGRLSIVPVYGPDADSEPHIELGGWDAYTVSAGKPDPFTVVNRATAKRTTFTRQENVPLMQPAWFQIGSNYQMGRSTWFTPPGDRLNLQEPPEDATTLQETLVSGDFGKQRPAAWPKASASIPAGDGIGLTDQNGDPVITAAWRRYRGDTLEESGNQPGFLTILSDAIPFTGEWVDAFRWRVDMGLRQDIGVTMRARWDAASESVQWSIGWANTESACRATCAGWVVEFTLNDSSVGYAEGASLSATFGVLDDGDALPGPDGSNALAASQEAYGVQEAEIHVRGYDVGLGTLAEIARAYVVANITPRLTRDIELSSVGSRVVFDDTGRLVELPNGEQGLLVSVDYGDDFTARAWRKTAQVQLLDATAPGAVTDEDTIWLTSLGEPWRLSSDQPAATELDPFWGISREED